MDTIRFREEKPMNEQQPTNFFDKNTMMAILLSFAVFFGWQQYMLKKYPPQEAAEIEAPANMSPYTVTAETSQSKEKTGTESQRTDSAQQKIQSLESLPTTYTFESQTMNFKLSSQGLAIFDLKLNNYNRRNGDPIVYASPIQFLDVNGQSLFQLQKINDTEYLGTSSSETQKVQVHYQIDAEKFQIKTKISVQNTSKNKVTVEAKSIYEVLPTPSSFLLPPTDFQEFFIATAEKNTREKVKPETESKITLAQTNIAAFNSQYFAQAFVNQSQIFPSTTATVHKGQAELQWKYETVEPVESMTTEYYIYVGPKKEDVLKSLDESLVSMIDYGIFGFIGRPMHTALLFIYKLVGNWGLAIILITLLLRTLILPAGVYSFRSMKKMQKIQPKLQAIKEKYKNDAQKANQETLLLLRAEKANPLSGCIPALLQLPIFIAFFTMMSSSFELYMQPFFLWIHDLSSKDPYYVFPILAGAAMFFQMKMTPTTTTDPAQAKIMSMMPLLFTVFMLSTPSGLALYMFIGSLFSIFQQVLFMKEKTT